MKIDFLGVFVPPSRWRENELRDHTTHCAGFSIKWKRNPNLTTNGFSFSLATRSSFSFTSPQFHPHHFGARASREKKRERSARCRERRRNAREEGREAEETGGVRRRVDEHNRTLRAHQIEKVAAFHTTFPSTHEGTHISPLICDKGMLSLRMCGSLCTRDLEGILLSAWEKIAAAVIHPRIDSRRRFPNKLSRVRKHPDAHRRRAAAAESGFCTTSRSLLDQTASHTPAKTGPRRMDGKRET